MTMQYVKPTDEQVAQMQVFRDKFQALRDELSKLPPSRGMALCFTKLDESAMWLNKALTLND